MGVSKWCREHDAEAVQKGRRGCQRVTAVVIQGSVFAGRSNLRRPSMPRSWTSTRYAVTGSAPHGQLPHQTPEVRRLKGQDGRCRGLREEEGRVLLAVGESF
ncbi:uncharacterized protein TrAFT101_002841 [Trichoderma asperellum]|uniref:uncharacterized protein n=1 Tax=Trichoderma asperellum TaxID=101201 RepID=UPI003327D46E|nr:hypothetical protein TrAFT101_002841 [Trichoderma asperellum]